MKQSKLSNVISHIPIMSLTKVKIRHARNSKNAICLYDIKMGLVTMRINFDETNVLKVFLQVCHLYSSL